MLLIKLACRLNGEQGTGLRAGYPLELGQPGKGLAGVLPAHFLARPQPDAHRRPVGPAKKAAAIVGGKLETTYARRFALGHPWDG